MAEEEEMSERAQHSQRDVAWRAGQCCRAREESNHALARAQHQRARCCGMLLSRGRASHAGISAEHRRGCLTESSTSFVTCPTWPTSSPSPPWGWPPRRTPISGCCPPFEIPHDPSSPPPPTPQLCPSSSPPACWYPPPPLGQAGA